jgi:acetolactate synthase I/II/III large subunit
VVRWLDQNTPEDTVFTNGAGNFRVWLHRFHQYTGIGTQVASTCGSMGYGLPAGIAAKLARPESLVVTFCGDGDFMMTGQELATAMLLELPIIILIINNGMYGTIRADQERNFPHRQIATNLYNPDFAALARAYGAYGELVEQTEDFAPAFERARASGKTAILELKLDPEAVTVDKTLSQLRPA